MTQSRCFSCLGEGTGTWCQLCSTAEPILDAFGIPVEDGKEGSWIQTWSGNKLWPLTPDPSLIRLMDIAVGESRENRYGKQTIYSYKVAEHSVIVSRLAGRFARAQRWPTQLVWLLEAEGLFHDGDEGILPDMPRPLKHDPTMNMGQFRLAGRRIQQAIFQRFGIETTTVSSDIIDTIDKRLVVDEVQQVMRKPELYLERHGHIQPCGVKLECLSEDDSKECFLERFAELFPNYDEIDRGDATFLP